MLILLTSCGPAPRGVSFSDWKDKHQGSYAILKARDGSLLQEARVDFQQRQLGHRSLKEFSPELVRELIQIEDQNFWRHGGIDPLALFAGAYARLRGGSRGGSTISMQVANLVWPSLRRESLYKLRQIQHAFFLESHWNKGDILEAYLNHASLKGEIRGMPAAARAFYGKDINELFFSERLWLYSMLPSPNARLDRIESRACRYGQKLDSTFKCEELARFRPGLRPMSPLEMAPHLFAHLNPRQELQTTIDLKLQLKAREILGRHIRHLRHHNVKDGAVLVVDRLNGEVLAYVGGVDSDASSAHVDHVQARRQAGSTLKPFLYAQAIQRKILTMDSPLMDSQFSITKEGFTYRPENHDRRFLNKAIPLKEALGSSLNIPAIRAIDLVGPAQFYQLLQQLGFNLPFEEDFYGHSMALGSVDVTLAELVQGYLMLSQSQHSPKLRYTLHAEADLLNPFDGPTSSIISHILSEKSYRVHSFGLSSVLNTSSWSAVKTGTSKDMRDNWCVGFTDRYVVGVWVGNSSGEPMWDVLGISGAGPVWHELIETLHERQPSRSPDLHRDLVAKNGSYFIKGTEPLYAPLTTTAKHVARIVSPTAFGHYAYDPEIPAQSQRLLLRAEGTEEMLWRLNGRILTAEEVKQGLSLEQKGRYELELLDRDLRKLDSIRYYIRAGKAQVSHTSQILKP